MLTQLDSEAKVYTFDEALKLSSIYFGGNDIAADTFVKKYALKINQNEILESTPSQMFDRMARALSVIEEPAVREKWEAVFRKQIDDFAKIVPQGSPMAALGNTYQRMTCANCYVVPIESDSLESMFKALYEMAQIQAFRGGVGIDLSVMRPEGSKVNNAALQSTGAWSWADLFSHVTRMVGQSGRQGALMLTMDVSHPDIEKFIAMKADLSKVTGGNVSVKLTDEFMRAVDKDTDFQLSFHFKDDKYPAIERTVRARDLMNMIVKYASKNGEPGILMWDTIIRRSPADAYAEQGFRTISTNPCAEIPLSQYDSCRLTSLNLTGFIKNRFIKGKAEFMWDSFKESIGTAIRILDNIVDIDYPLQPFAAQRESNRNGRRLGLGTHGLADALAMLGKRYDADSTIKFADKMYEFFKVEAYRASIELAKERGPFPIWNWEQEKDNEFIKELPDDIRAEMAKYGRRNIALLTCAPTGSVSIVSKTSSGIEPIFRLSYVRRVKVNQADLFDPSEIEVDAATGDKWRRFEVYHPAYQEWQSLEPSQRFGDDIWATSGQIDYKQRVKMQAVITKHLDHASSSTINLPKGTPESVVGDIYLMAWKLGLKGVTVYIDGSRDGVLLTTDDKKKSGVRTRPIEVDAVAHTIGSNGGSYVVFIGFVDGNPFEVFAVPGKVAAVSDGLKGKIIKTKLASGKNRYDFVSGKDEDGDWSTTVAKINKNEATEASSITRLVSTALRYNVPIADLNDQLDKARGNITDLAKALNRVLAKYVGRITGRTCPECGSNDTIFEEGCMRCVCGYSKCS